MKQLSDQALMQALCEGNSQALTELHHRFARPLHYFFCRGLEQSPALAEDLVQDLFVRLFQKCEQFDPKRNFRAWVYSIAHNMLKNEYAKMEVRQRYSAESKAQQESFYDERSSYEQIQLSEQIYAALEGEELLKREAFILRFREDLKIKEIAEILDLPEGTVKSGLHYSIKKIQSKLGTNE